MRTYTFNIVLEPDEDRWHAYCPALREQGAATWGHTPEESLQNIEEVVRLVMESMVDHKERLPRNPSSLVIETEARRNIEDLKRLKLIR